MHACKHALICMFYVYTHTLVKSTNTTIHSWALYCTTIVSFFPPCLFMSFLFFIPFAHTTHLLIAICMAFHKGSHSKYYVSVPFFELSASELTAQRSCSSLTSFWGLLAFPSLSFWLEFLFSGAHVFLLGLLPLFEHIATTDLHFNPNPFSSWIQTIE